MSQQTQIDRAAAAAEAFCARFPTPASLAEAAPADAVRAWSGLGYNRRAIALHRAASAIVESHRGAVPADVEALDALPGVGAYTARAVAVHAFGVPVAPVDVNVASVVGRLVGSADRRTIEQGAHALLDPDDPSRTVHALMDLAAIVCRRRAPACHACPLAFACASVHAPVPVPAPAAIRRSSKPPTPFPQTRRWLRGALLRELVAAPDAAWRDFDGRSMGSHPPHAVREALATLASDGLIELDPTGRARLAETPDTYSTRKARTWGTRGRLPRAQSSFRTEIGCGETNDGPAEARPSQSVRGLCLGPLIRGCR